LVSCEQNADILEFCQNQLIFLGHVGILLD